MSDQIRKLLVLYTGGTIGMAKNERGVLVPVPGIFTKKLKTIEGLYDKKLANQLPLADNQLVMKTTKGITVIYKIKEYEPLLDSSNMSIKDWKRIAIDIENNYCDFDGFVILHGTDTLAFTSSVLSFMFENLSKPVILTGAQIPIFDTCTDAIQNIIMSLTFASSYKLPEVAVFFYNKLFRGNRVRKMNALEFESFDSPNYHPLAKVHLGRRRRECWPIKFYNFCVLECQNPNLPLKVHMDLNCNVGIIYFYPTITGAQIEAFLKPPLVGVVIQTFGAGDIPSNNKEIIKSLKDAAERGVVIINVTQCSKGAVTNLYETIQALQQIGVIAGGDMTVEAAYAKLVVILGMPNKSEQTFLLRENIRGELSE